MRSVKRFVVLIIALLYLAASSGVTMHMHYCMGQHVTTTFTEEEGDDHHCSHCGMTKKKGGNGCCNDEQKIVKVDDDHSLTKDIKTPVPVFAEGVLTKVSYQLTSTPLFTKTVRRSFHAHAPPDPDPLPVYLSIRNLRI